MIELDIYNTLSETLDPQDMEILYDLCLENNWASDIAYYDQYDSQPYAITGVLNSRSGAGAVNIFGMNTYLKSSYMGSFAWSKSIQLHEQ
jgi:hypothetical protein